MEKANSNVSVGPYRHSTRGEQLPENPDLGLMSPTFFYASMVITAYALKSIIGLECCDI